jgi:hypothetical protein
MLRGVNFAFGLTIAKIVLNKDVFGLVRQSIYMHYHGFVDEISNEQDDSRWRCVVRVPNKWILYNEAVFFDEDALCPSLPDVRSISLKSKKAKDDDHQSKKNGIATLIFGIFFILLVIW